MVNGEDKFVIGGFPNLLIKPVIAQGYIPVEGGNSVGYSVFHYPENAPFFPIKSVPCFPEILFGYVLAEHANVETVLARKRFADLVSFYFNNWFPNTLKLASSSQMFSYGLVQRASSAEILKSFKLLVPVSQRMSRSNMREFEVKDTERFRVDTRFIILSGDNETSRNELLSIFLPQSKLSQCSYEKKIYGADMDIHIYEKQVGSGKCRR